MIVYSMSVLVLVVRLGISLLNTSGCHCVWGFQFPKRQLWDLVVERIDKKLST